MNAINSTLLIIFRKFGLSKHTFMAQVLDKEIHRYWDLLNTTQKKSILSMIKSFLQPAEKGSPISIEQYNKELDEAMKRINEGKFITHEDLEKEMDKW